MQCTPQPRNINPSTLIIQKKCFSLMLAPEMHALYPNALAKILSSRDFGGERMPRLSIPPADDTFDTFDLDGFLAMDISGLSPCSGQVESDAWSRFEVLGVPNWKMCCTNVPLSAKAATHATHLLRPFRSAHRSQSGYATYVQSVESVLSTWPLTLRRFSHGCSTSRCGLIFFKPSGICWDRSGDLISLQAHDSQP
jgi:hypothetical protein